MIEMKSQEIFSVEGRAIVVTGASSGLGERFARVLAENGASVLAVARRADRLDALAGEYAGIEPFTADLADENQRGGVIDAALDRFGRLDVLVNNAGFGKPAAAIDEPMQDFRSVMELNLFAVFELSRLAARHMIEQRRGSIINNASVLGLVASTPIKNASYSASKGAAINLTRELACQWARKGVRVNALAPGFFPSESSVGMEAGTPAGDFILSNCPMARIGDERELDGALLFLASDASSYYTGQVLTVDGGWTAR
jgi:NAD(P)-dependent dehydrogenase (short-subunit alcohol dehydrogenase family)